MMDSNWIVAIATCVYAGLAVLQWLAIRHQANLTHQSLDIIRREVDAANRSATAAFQSAQAAEAGARAAEATSRSSEAAQLHTVLSEILGDYRSAEMLL